LNESRRTSFAPQNKGIAPARALDTPINKLTYSLMNKGIKALIM